MKLIEYATLEELQESSKQIITGPNTSISKTAIDETNTSYSFSTYEFGKRKELHIWNKPETTQSRVRWAMNNMSYGKIN